MPTDNEMPKPLERAELITRTKKPDPTAKDYRLLHCTAESYQDHRASDNFVSKSELNQYTNVWLSLASGSSSGYAQLRGDWSNSRDPVIAPRLDLSSEEWRGFPTAQFRELNGIFLAGKSSSFDFEVYFD